jgi:hypothetical protein
MKKNAMQETFPTGFLVIRKNKLAAILSLLAMYTTACSANPQEHYSISSVAQRIQILNRTLPKKMTQDLELTDVTLLKKVINYNYRFLLKGYEPLFIANLNKKSKAHVIYESCHNQSTLGLIKHGYELSYNYSDSNCKNLSKIRVRITDCS